SRRNRGPGSPALAGCRYQLTARTRTPSRIPSDRAGDAPAHSRSALARAFVRRPHIGGMTQLKCKLVWDCENMQVAPGLTTTLRDEPSSPADPAPPAPPGAEPSSPRESAPHPQAIAIVKRTLALILAAVVLYGVAPAILEVLGAYRRLGDV